MASDPFEPEAPSSHSRIVARDLPGDPTLVWIPEGRFRMGSNRHYPEEAPEHDVEVDGFWMDRYPVTNRDFARFVDATGYVTVAERPVDPRDYPGAAPELLVPGSAVFRKPTGPVNLDDCLSWWTYVPGASWKHPEGPGSTIAGRELHPVVHVAYEDAEAYARWAGKELPTEAEWERAARGRHIGAEFCWGNEATPSGRHLANYWQGPFPWHNSVEDGFEGTSPVGSFPPNDFGLYDMAGNVWEWTSTWFAPHHEHPAVAERPCCVPRNPTGPSREQSVDPRAPRFPRKVLKGGSFLCAANYCFRYRPAARFAQTIDTAACHIGFRCVLHPPRPT
ncbi:MAG: formylglycine-generating enzyme family protein [Pseudomonadota bacterium]